MEPSHFYIPAPPIPIPAPVTAAIIAAHDDPFAVHPSTPAAPVNFGGHQYAHLPANLAQQLANIPADRQRHQANAAPMAHLAYPAALPVSYHCYFSTLKYNANY